MCEYFSHSAIRATLKTAFPTVQTYIQHVPTFFAQWSFVIAGNSGLNVNLDPKTIDARIAERLGSSLRFYDGEAHRRLLSVPRDIERVLATSGTVLTNEHDFSEAYEASQTIYGA